MSPASRFRDWLVGYLDAHGDRYDATEIARMIWSQAKDHGLGAEEAIAELSAVRGLGYRPDE